MIKKLNSLGIFLALQILFCSVFVSFALSDPPELVEVLDIAGRILNIAVGVAGIVLVAMVAYGVWKSSLSVGDPRGLEGAKQTWTYALYGFFIIVGSFAAFLIMTGILGITLSPASLLTNISTAITDLLNPL